jgi:hypothetical protein
MKRYGVPGTGHISKAIAPPSAAVGYFGKSGSRNWEPALLWLVIAVIALNTIRNGGQLPNGKQAAGWIGLAGVVVVGGAFVPGIVAAVLVGLLFVSALGTPGLAAAIAKVNTSISALGTAA